MSNNITPPPELVEQWVALLPQGSMKAFTAAAQWGADQELEACCSLIDLAHSDPAATGDHRLVDKTVLLKQLRAARRPKPPSLKEQALQALRHAPGPDYPDPITLLTADEHALIRRALEQLDD